MPQISWLTRLFESLSNVLSKGEETQRQSKPSRPPEQSMSDSEPGNRGSVLETALRLIKEHEGGYVDHPRDPGGCTNMGITLSTYRRRVDPKATCEDLRNIEWDTAKHIYEWGYWIPCRCDDLPPAVAISVFDFAVNAGPGTAIRKLQQAVDVADDGIVGPITLAAVGRYRPVDLAQRYADARLAYYRSLSTFDVFGRGWIARTEKTLKVARGAIG